NVSRCQSAGICLDRVEIRSAGNGISYGEIKGVGQAEDTHLGNAIGLAVGGIWYGLSAGRNIFWLHSVRFLNHFGKQPRIHESNRGQQVPGSGVVKPCIVVLAFGLVVPGMLQVPDAIVPKSCLGTNIESGQLPAAQILKNGGQRIGTAVADKILNHNAVFACGKAGEVELGAAGAHSAGFKDTTVEPSIGTGSGARIQQERASDLGAAP